MRAVRLAKESGVTVAVEATGFSRASIYRWIRAFDERGITALLEESRRPQRMRVTVPSWVDT
ncbi:helix-turn-helix domain-containing protein, partial [Candidatus Nephthysia bennettiae]|uniref:helix-turn-helix domain-containing protein n=1 Tax=Candidatus Nephthysia bennettiae TaxID=3127016 RepID=UPI0030C66A38